MARSPLFPARPVPKASTKAAVGSRTASWACPIVPKGAIPRGTAQARSGPGTGRAAPCPLTCWGSIGRSGSCQVPVPHPRQLESPALAPGPVTPNTHGCTGTILLLLELQAHPGASKPVPPSSAGLHVGLTQDWVCSSNDPTEGFPVGTTISMELVEGTERNVTQVPTHFSLVFRAAEHNSA